MISMRAHTRRATTLSIRIITMLRSIAFALLAATLCCGVALADDYQVKMLRISNPFARATPPGAKVAGAFMSIENRGKEADRLVSASSPVAGLVEIHEMAMDGGMMKMRAIKGVDVKPGATVELQPGGYHVMLEDLKQPLKQGDQIPVSLTFEKAGVIEIKVHVEAMGAAAHTH
jgi:copper(I)-binding protein